MAVNIKSLETVKTLGGSTGAKLLEDKSNGRKYVLKRGDSKEHAQEEYTANKIYEALGVDIPETYLYQCDSGDFFLLHEYIESSENANQAMDEEMAKRVTKHFVADALLANWDVYKNDNILIGSEDGKLYRIDNGGALRFRAQGAPKRGFGAEVTELETLKDNNPYITSFLTTEDINNQIADVISKKEKALAVIKDDKLRKIMEDRFNYLEGNKMAKGGSVDFETDEKIAEMAFGSEAYGALLLGLQRGMKGGKGLSSLQAKKLADKFATMAFAAKESKFSGKMAKGGYLVTFEDDGQYETEKFDSLDEAKDFYNFISEQKMNYSPQKTQLISNKDGKVLMGARDLPQLAKGGSLDSHGLEVGDRIIEDLGYALLVQDKRGTMMYVDLSNGNRDTEAPLPFAKGGEVILEDGDEGKKFDAKKYPAFLQDFDGDGIANIDDPNPLKEGDKDTIEQVKMEKVFKKLLAEKEKMKPKMYNLVGRIKDEVPSGSTILFRTKTPYSIINKLVDKRMTDPKKGLTDMIGTMVVVKDRKELDALNKRIKAGEFGEIIDSDDYYKNPKGGYRAYHYIIMTDGSPAELQIKTKRQKLLNETSHKPYKQKELNAKRLGELSLLADKADRGIKAAILQFDAVTEDSESLLKELTLKKKS